MSEIPVYDKAIRDKIPEIIEASGSMCELRVLSDDEFLPHLEKKLQEELEEYNESKFVTELVDIIEVIYRIAGIRSVSREELERMRLDKLNERGGFQKNLYLIKTS